MKKFIINKSVMFLAILMFAFSITGCASKKSSEELLKEAMKNSIEIKSSETTMDATLSFSADGTEGNKIAQSLGGLSQGDISLVLNGKAINNDKFDYTASVMFNGAGIEAEIFGTKDLFYISNPLVGGYMKYSTEELEDKDDFYKTIEDVQESFGKYITNDFELKDIFVLGEPVNETIEINGENVKVFKIESGITVDNIRDVALSFLGFIKNDENIMDLAEKNYNLSGAGLNEGDIIKELDSAIDQIENYSDEDLQEELKKIKPYLEGLKITFYIDKKGYLVRSDISFDYEDDEYGQISFNSTQTVYNMNNVKDFELKEVDDSEVQDLTEYLNINN